MSGPFVETPRIFLCMQNTNYAEILAWKKNDYYFKIFSDRGLAYFCARVIVQQRITQSRPSEYQVTDC